MSFFRAWCALALEPSSANVYLATQPQATDCPVTLSISRLLARSNSFGLPLRFRLVRDDRLGLASSWRMIRAFVLNSPYPTAPFSTLYLFGRGQEIGFQKAIDNSPRKRHHIRFWALSTARAEATLMDDVTMVPPTSILTWQVMAPFVTWTILPLSLLRALSLWNFTHRISPGIAGRIGVVPANSSVRSTGSSPEARRDINRTVAACASQVLPQPFSLGKRRLYN